jgi:hypothetical protein
MILLGRLRWFLGLGPVLYGLLDRGWALVF